MAEQNIVYVLTNSAMTGLVKIGITTDDVEKRIKELYTSGVPFPFNVAYAAKVNDAKKVEKALHQAFDDMRPNKNREFFKIKPEQAVVIIKLLEIEDITPGVQREYADDIEQTDAESMEAAKQFERKQEIEREIEARQRRPNINFHDMGIKNGEELQYFKGDIIAVVCDARHVLYDNNKLSLTALTQSLMQSPYTIQPTKYWSYNGKNLLEIYDETYPPFDE